MFIKGTKFFADWRDAKGVRRRKAFETAKGALAFEAEQKELAHPKRQARGTTSRPSFAQHTAKAQTRTIKEQRGRSLPAQVVSIRRNSAARMSTKRKP
jgi:hypothetical protein